MKWNSTGGKVLVEELWWNSYVEQLSGTLTEEQLRGTVMVKESRWNTEVEQ